MHIEIEAKLRVDSLARVSRRLKAIGAEFIGKLLQVDTHFDDAKGMLRKFDSTLRLRRQSSGLKSEAILAFKGPRQKSRFKQRQEIELAVSNGDLAEMLIAELGFRKVIVIKKRRSVWQFGGCEVSLDELPVLGSFVEIEGPNEKKIAAVQKKLGLAGLPHIPESYASLMERKLRKGNPRVRPGAKYFVKKR
jgi:adenylate cyclase class 2